MCRRLELWAGHRGTGEKLWHGTGKCGTGLGTKVSVWAVVLVGRKVLLACKSGGCRTWTHGSTIGTGRKVWYWASAWQRYWRHLPLQPSCSLAQLRTGGGPGHTDVVAPGGSEGGNKRTFHLGGNKTLWLPLKARAL